MVQGQTATTSSDSLWALLRDLNCAKVNKEALDDAIEEEEALMELLRKLSHRVGSFDDRGRDAPQPMSSQCVAFRYIDDETQRIYGELNRLKQIQQDESLELQDAEVMGISLALQLKSSACCSAPVADPASLTELKGMVDDKRASCHKWLREQQALSGRVAELAAQNEQLDKECVHIQERTGTLDARQSLLREIASMEAAIDTLVKLISIAPLPVRVAHR
jgi:predicted nuclease with TOPRIM domain